MNRIFVCALVICGSVALLAPGLRQAEPAPEPADTTLQLEADDPRSDGSASTGDWYGDGTVLQRAGNGHFYARGTIEGAEINLMVDTGASVIALTGEDAMAAGLQWDDADVRNIGSGASGAVYGVQTILRQVDIDGIVQQDVPAVIVPEGLEVSLLGQSFLSRIDSVQIDGNRMVLGGG